MERWIRNLITVLGAVCDLAVPLACPCGTEGTVLCPECAARLRHRPRRVEAGAPALQVLASSDASRGAASLVFAPVMPVLALGEHAGALRRIVLSWKNGGQLRLAQPLGAALAPGAERMLRERERDGGKGSGGEDGGEGGGVGKRGCVTDSGEGGIRRPLDPRSVHLVPVPSALSHRVRRGADHTAELAEEIARRTGCRTARPLGLHGPGQAGRGGRDRRAARTGRIRVRGAGAGMRRVILVDDVLTTGTTLRDAHDALTARGIEVLGALVVTAARPPRPASVPGGSGGADRIWEFGETRATRHGRIGGHTDLRDEEVAPPIQRRAAGRGSGRPTHLGGP